MSISGNRSNSRIEFPDDDYVNDKLSSLIRSRTSYVGKLTKSINDITALISNFGDDTTHERVNIYNDQLEHNINQIRNITADYCKIQNNETKSSEVLNYCTDQEFRVIQIRKSINSYFDRCNFNKDRSVHNPPLVDVTVHSLPLVDVKLRNSHHSNQSRSHRSNDQQSTANASTSKTALAAHRIWQLSKNERILNSPKF